MRICRIWTLGDNLLQELFKILEKPSHEKTIGETKKASGLTLQNGILYKIEN